MIKVLCTLNKFSIFISRLSWEEESNVSTGDDNSPAGKTFYNFVPFE